MSPHLSIKLDPRHFTVLYSPFFMPVCAFLPNASILVESQISLVAIEYPARSTSSGISKTTLASAISDRNSANSFKIIAEFLSATFIASPDFAYSNK